MATLLKRSPRYKRSWINYHHQYRTYFTGSRYSGYVNYFHNENLFGFVVREDAPEREYYFHVTDLHAENIPRVRPLQPVEFSIMEGRGGNFMARDISALGGQPIRYAHSNMKMKEEERTRNLSELPNAELERHTGVVVSIMPSGKGGLIVPDRLNFAALGYSATEIQSTGAQRLDRFSEVEFYARPSKYDRKDRAVCITRRGGGLITAERRNTGHSRRLLGAMYGPNDLQAQIPRDFAENRRRGYVANYSREKLFGFIVPFDDPIDSQGFFVHIDDCHIYGARFLKRFQEVEFSVVTDAATGKSKALHVSGPNKTVLRSVSENRYLPTTLTNTKLAADENQRYHGSIMVTSPAVHWFIIKPDAKGCEPVIGYKNHVHTLGNRRLHLDDCLEFTVAEPTEDHEGGLLRAMNITAPGGKPLLCDVGPLAKYLQTKLNLPHFQNELPEYDMSTYSQGTILRGFVTNFSPQYKFGNIEIESNDPNTRYRRVFFKLDDCVLPADNIDLESIWIREGSKIQFELASIDYENEFQHANRRRVFDKAEEKESSGEQEEQTAEQSELNFHYEEVEPIVHIKAMNVMSEGLDFLEVGQSNATQQQVSFDHDTEPLGYSSSERKKDSTTQIRLDEDDSEKKQEKEEEEPLFGDFDEEDDAEEKFK